MFKYAILFFVLFSCSASYHLNKAVKKGAQLETINVPTYVYDTIYDTVENKVIIRTRIKDTIWSEKTIVRYVPKTRIEYRYDYKLFRDSLRHVQKLYKDSIHLEKKRSLQALKNERKKNNLSTRIIRNIMFFFVLILIVYIALRIIIKKLL